MKSAHPIKRCSERQRALLLFLKFHIRTSSLQIHWVTQGQARLPVGSDCPRLNRGSRRAGFGGTVSTRPSGHSDWEPYGSDAAPRTKARSLQTTVICRPRRWVTKQMLTADDWIWPSALACIHLCPAARRTIYQRPVCWLVSSRVFSEAVFQWPADRRRESLNSCSLALCECVCLCLHDVLLFMRLCTWEGTRSSLLCCSGETFDAGAWRFSLKMPLIGWADRKAANCDNRLRSNRNWKKWSWTDAKRDDRNDPTLNQTKVNSWV